LCADGLSIPQQKDETIRFLAWDKRLISFVKHSHQLWGPTSVLSGGYLALPSGEDGRNVTFITDLHLLLNLRMTWDIRPLPLTPSWPDTDNSYPIRSRVFVQVIT
jgi:hypothetical protein